MLEKREWLILSLICQEALKGSGLRVDLTAFDRFAGEITRLAEGDLIKVLRAGEHIPLSQAIRLMMIDSTLVLRYVPTDKGMVIDRLSPYPRSRTT